MKTDKTKRSGDNESFSPELTEAIAFYFERLNGSSEPGDPAALLRNQPELLAEWEELLALLRVPQKVKQVSAASAWQRFRRRAFDIAPEAQSLGSYVAANESNVLAESGLSKATIEKMKADPTPLNELKNYELKDFVDVARRNGVNDTAFPRMLKWLKGLGKGLFTPMGGSRLQFAREEDYKHGLSESEAAEKLNDDENN